MNRTHAVAVILSFGLGLSVFPSQAQIVRIEELPVPDFIGTAGVSRIADDGTVVGTGWIDGMVVRWRPGQAPEDLGGAGLTYTLENIMPLMSADGSVIAANLYFEHEPGNPDAGIYPRTAIWQGGTAWQPIDNAVFDEDTPYGISANGAYLVGSGVTIPSEGEPWVEQAWIWSAAAGQQALGAVDGLPNAQAWTVSDDGQTVAGFAAGSAGAAVRYGVRWDAGVAQRIFDAEDQPVGQAMACNTDCSLLVGAGMIGPEGSKEAWRWTAETGVQFLGTLPSADPTLPYYAFDSSDDGRIIVGSYSRIGLDGSVMNRGFLWTEDFGMVDLVEFLAAHGIDYGADFNELVVNSITRDGTRLLANGGDQNYQRQRAIVTIVPRLFGDDFETAAVE